MPASVACVFPAEAEVANMSTQLKGTKKKMFM